MMISDEFPLSEASSQLLDGVRILLRASVLARDAGRTAWDFAVEIRELRDLGLSNCDLRWLLCKGYIDQGVEISDSDEEGRAFEDRGDLRLWDNSCFVLTARGARAVSQNGANDSVSTSNGVPSWNADRRELRFGNEVVKKYRVPAANQELILSAFEEESWPYSIDDPLPPAPEQNSKRRLHATIQSLNRNQRRTTIRFRGNGQADGVCWELCKPLGRGNNGRGKT